MVPGNQRDESALSVLTAVANWKASNGLFDQELAEITYAICALDAKNLRSQLRLGRALATLGDRQGATEIFKKAASTAKEMIEGKLRRFRQGEENLGNRRRRSAMHACMAARTRLARGE